MLELDNKYYDKIYKQNKNKGGEYSKPPLKSIYANVWLKALSILSKSERIFDLGCGPGQFARLLIKNKYNFIYGIDFSEQAIKMAQSLNTKFKKFFYVKNIKDELVYNLHRFDTVVSFEVLEHITEDLSVVENIPSGKRFIFSVPNYWTKGHVRVYESSEEIVKRYSELLDIKAIYPIKMNNENTIFLVDSKRK